MVTTRSADKRANHDKEDLVLRAKAIASSPSKEPTPLASLRKRATDSQSHANSPRQKRARTGSDGAHDSHQDIEHTSHFLPAHEEHHSQVTLTVAEAQTGDPDHETQSKHEVIISAEPESTPKATRSSELPLTGDEPSSAKSSATVQPYLTPKPLAHKRFDSQEPEDDSTIVVMPPGTDSSAHQEYQTADEEISDSDEAPEVATTKARPAKPERATTGRTQRIRKKANADVTAEADEKVVAGVGLTAVQAKVDEHDAEGAAEEVMTGDAEHGEKPAHPVAEPTTANPATHSQPGPPSKTDLETNDTVITPASMPSGSQFRQLPAPASPTNLTTTKPQATPSQTGLSDPIINSTTVNVNSETQLTPHKSTTTKLSSPISTSTTPHNRFYPPSARPIKDNNDRQSTSSKLPDRKRTTLSDHRQALLERRAERSGGTFRLEATWSKKRATFAA
ncbi:hypothetical protein H2198_009137 [Neophaeococcomyces mojaviensis]|uniref:Uncharacterized protein n=1 Tax=Neophaeococcomyces mojaviensis TaxID=3383035 RepID=A0ACC2ZVE6_9EURO|nr:hypothetical protein H2198_009137 [Knufia sp. JES_112]